MVRYDLQGTKKRRKKVRLAWKRLLFLAAFILFAVILITGIRVLSPYRDVQNTSEWAMSMREAEEDKGINYLLYGLRETEDGVSVEEMFVLNFFSLDEDPHLVYIPGNILMQRLDNNRGEVSGNIEIEGEAGDNNSVSAYYLPGNYYEEGGSELLLEQLSLFLDVPFHYFIEMHYEGLPVLVDNLDGAVYKDEVLKGEDFWRVFIAEGWDESPLERSRQRASLLQELFIQAEEESGVFASSSLLRETSPYLDTNLEWNELKELFLKVKGLFEPGNLIVELPGQWEDFNQIEYFEPHADGIASLTRNLGSEFILPRGMIKVEVLNGCGIAGAAGKVGDILAEEGFQIVNVDDADSFDYEQSQVISRLDDVDAAREVAALVPGSELLKEPRPEHQAMVTVIVGQNYPI